MTWQATYKVFDTGVLQTNLLAFLRANQVDALAWANGNSPLPKFKHIYANPQGRVYTEFPVLTLMEQSLATEFGDHNTGVWSIEIELGVMDSSNDALALIVPKYKRALESMLRNITVNDLLGASVANRDFIQIVNMETKDVKQGSNGTQHGNASITTAYYKLTGSY